MKKSIAFLFLLTVIGCSKNTGTSKFVGTWRGNYSSTMIITNPSVFDTGTLQITIDADHSAIGTLQSLHGGAPTIMKGTVDISSGVISMSKYAEGNYGIIVFLEGLNGNLSVDSGSGTLTFPWAAISSWQATRN